MAFKPESKEQADLRRAFVILSLGIAGTFFPGRIGKLGKALSILGLGLEATHLFRKREAA